MILKTNKTVLLLITSMLLTCAVTVVSAQVYKTVDENGNVVFTDTPPSSGAKPIELAPVSVIEAPTYKAKEKPVVVSKNAGDLSPADMKKAYADFALISPRAGEAVWNPKVMVKAAWKTTTQLQAGMKVNIYVDDELHQTTTEQIVPLGALPRGAHIVSAELVDSKNRKIATATPIAFSVYQPMNYPDRPEPSQSQN